MIKVVNQEYVATNKINDVVNRCRTLRGLLSSLEILMTPRGYALTDKEAVKALKEIVNTHIMEVNSELDDLLDKNELTCVSSQFYCKPVKSHFISDDDDKLI